MTKILSRRHPLAPMVLTILRKLKKVALVQRITSLVEVVREKGFYVIPDATNPNVAKAEEEASRLAEEREGERDVEQTGQVDTTSTGEAPSHGESLRQAAPSVGELAGEEAPSADGSADEEKE
jgi:hypothetical protein